MFRFYCLRVSEDNLRFVWLLESLDLLVAELNMHSSYYQGHDSGTRRLDSNDHLPASSSRFFKRVVPTIGAVTLVKLQAVAI